ncbi:hypothetical protein CHX27_06895 [Flavobacterium aurantiibacter]|uniref:Uncharacterized protein n=1 Tax=Flavobacterium aurantiibacter TaxID=2023067 RepID=A0A255ZWF7_9FLAO|nr:hypothetical protein CHX27_06895 [Flavobacterium aurantiibacter]
MHGFAKRSLSLSKRRRAIRFIFLAVVLWKFCNAKKDIAAIAHPKVLTKYLIIFNTSCAKNNR